MADGPNLVALRDKREQTIEVLSSCYANDLLEIHEFERRVELAEQAESVAALDKLTVDLRVNDIARPDEYQPGTDLVPAASNAISTDVPDDRNMYCILGGTNKAGTWSVPRKLTIWAVMGGAELDMREAVFAPGVTEVKINSLLGGAEIIVPPGLDVEMDGSAFLGGFEDAERTGASSNDPNRPRLRISGFAVLGGVELSERYPGESSREARRRRKRQRKELKAKRRAELKAARRKQLGDGE